MKTNKVFLVGICGPSGSGKTTLSQSLQKMMGDKNLTILQEDSYYKDFSHLTVEQREKINFDHPNAFDYQLLDHHLKFLLSGKNIQQPQYDYITHCRTNKTSLVKSSRIIILEGLLILNHSKFRNLMTMKVFIDTKIDICLIRRIQRDINERGRELTSIINQYIRTVRPMYFKFVKPSKEFADIIIPHGGENDSAINILHSNLDKLIEVTPGL